MYIGATNSQGIVYLLKEILQNNLPKYPLRAFNLEIGKAFKAKISLEGFPNPIAMNWLHYKEQTSIAENLLGLYCLSALSKDLKLLFWLEGILVDEQFFKYGKLLKASFSSQLQSTSKIELEFHLDPLILGDNFEWEEDLIWKELNFYSYLFPNCTFHLKSQNQSLALYHPLGAWDWIQHQRKNKTGRLFLKLQQEATVAGFYLKVALAFDEDPVKNLNIVSFVNDHHTPLGGEHQEAVIEGIYEGLIDGYSLEGIISTMKITKPKIKKHLYAFIQLDMLNPEFRGSTRSKLGSEEVFDPIKATIKVYILDYLSKNPNNRLRLSQLFKIGD